MKTRHILATSVAALVSASALTPSASAQVTWDNTAGTNLWSTGTNWSTDVEPTIADSATFPAVIPGSATITLAAGETAASLNFLNSYTLTGGDLTLGGTTSITIAPTFTAVITTPLSAGTTSSLTFANSGATPGTITLGGTSSIAGTAAITIDPNVTVNLGNNSASGTLSSGNAANVTNNGVLRFNRTNGTTFAGIISGSGAVNLANNSGIVVTLTGANTYTGGTNIGGSNVTIRVGSDSVFGTGIVNVQGGTITSDIAAARIFGNNFSLTAGVTLGSGTAGNNGLLTFNGNFDMAAGTRTITANSPVIINGVLSNGGLAKAGGGSLTLRGANTINLAFTSNQGLFVVEGPNGSINLVPTITIGDLGGADESATFGNIADVVAGPLDRIGDTATLSLNGTGAVIFNGPATGSGGNTETIGSLALPAGRGFVTLNPGTGNEFQLTATTLSRTGNSSLFLRGDLLGASGVGSTRLVAGNGAAVAVGGGGPAGSLTQSIIPFAVGDDSSTGAGDSFLTHDATTGLRPLTNAEFDATIAGAGTQRNVSVVGAEVVAAAATINALRVTGGTTTLNAPVTVGSGAVLFTAAGTLDGTGPLAFGTAEGNITVGQNTTAVTGTISAPISGAGGLVVSSTGDVANTVFLSGENTFIGGITVNNGNLRVGSAGALNQLALNDVTLRPNGILQVNDNTVVLRNLRGQSGSQLQNAGAGTGTAIIIADAAAQLDFSGGLNNGATGTLAVTKRGTQTFVLNNNSANFSGALNVERGIFQLTNQARLTGGSAAVTISGGSILRLTNSTGTTNVQGDRIPNARPVTINGGTFDFDNNASGATSYSETVGALTLLAGNNVVTVDRAVLDATTPRSSVLTFASLTRNPGGTLFTGANTALGVDGRSRLVFTAPPTPDDGIIGGWAYGGTGNNEFLKYVADADPVAGGNQPSATPLVAADYNAGTEATFAATVNAKPAASTTLTAARSLNSLNLVTAVDVDLAGNTLNVESGGVIKVGTGVGITSTGSQGTLTAGGAAAGELIVRAADAATTVDLTAGAGVIITDNSGPGVVSLLKNGVGALTLNSANTYTGSTSIVSGTVNISADTGLGTAPGAATPAHLRLYNNGILNATATMTLNANRGLEIGGGAGILGTAAGAVLTYNGAITFSPSSELIVRGAGTVNMTPAAALTAPAGITVGSGGLNGILNFTGAPINIGTLLSDADLSVGIRTGTETGSTDATFDLTGAGLATVRANNIQVGVIVSNTAGGQAGGALILPTNSDIVARTAFTINDSPQNGPGNALDSIVTAGAGTTDIRTPLLVVGGRKASGGGTFNVAAGGVVNLNGFAPNTADLFIARNNAGTGTVSLGLADFTNGTLNASLDEVVIGSRTTGTNNNGGANGTLSLGTASHVISANSVLLGQQEGAAANVLALAQGTINQAGGSFTVANDVTLGSLAGTLGTTRGSLNLTGGTFTIGGNITKAGGERSSGLITVAGGVLDLTGGTISASQLAFRSGTLSNVASATLDGATVTDGLVFAPGADALILRDVIVPFAVNLTGTTANTAGIHYETGGAGTGGFINGNVDLGTVVRNINVENSAAATDLDINGSISGVLGGVNKTGLGNLEIGSTNTYTGGTTVTEGTLTVATGSVTGLGTGNVSVLNTAISLTLQTGVTNAIADTATLSLAGGGGVGADAGFAFLGSGVNELVQGLILGGAPQGDGTYGATGSGATNINDDFFAGPGIVTVMVPEPGALVSLLGGFGALCGLQRFRRRNA